MTDPDMYADAAAQTRAAADAAPVAERFDVRAYRPVHEKDLDAIWRALRSMQTQLDALTRNKETP